MGLGPQLPPTEVISIVAEGEGDYCCAFMGHSGPDGIAWHGIRSQYFLLLDIFNIGEQTGGHLGHIGGEDNQRGSER